MTSHVAFPVIGVGASAGIYEAIPALRTHSSRDVGVTLVPLRSPDIGGRRGMFPLRMVAILWGGRVVSGPVGALVGRRELHD